MGQNPGKSLRVYARSLNLFKCIRSILRIYWPDKISNYELRRKTCVRPVPLEVKRCRWRWIGHICRMPLVAIPRMASVGLQMEKERGEDPGRRGAGDEGERMELGACVEGNTNVSS